MVVMSSCELGVSRGLGCSNQAEPDLFGEKPLNQLLLLTCCTLPFKNYILKKWGKTLSQNSDIPSLKTMRQTISQYHHLVN